MFEEMESSFLPVPTLDVVSGRFRVVLQNNPIFGIDDPKWPQAVRALPISLTQKRAIVGLVDREFSNADYCALNAVDRDTAYRDLHDLVERGLLQATGSGAGTRYRVVRSSVSSAAPSNASPMERLATRMAEAGFITNTDYRDAFDVDRNAAKAALATWVGQGVLVREGRRRWTRYRPGDRWHPE
jgi:predicted HTH transcriptional regulator